MNELVSRIATNVGVDPDVAAKAVGAILEFLQSEGPADKVQEMMAAVPGAADLIALAPSDGRRHGPWPEADGHGSRHG